MQDRVIVVAAREPEGTTIEFGAIWPVGADAALLDPCVRQRSPVAQDQIITQAHQNRTRVQERDTAKRHRTLRDLQTTAASPRRTREHL